MLAGATSKGISVMRFVGLIVIVLLTASCDEPRLPDAPLPTRAAIAHAPAEIAFIKAQLNALQPRSIAENREYCGYLGVTLDGNLAVSPAQQGDISGCTPIDPPAGLQPLASYHTHAAYSVEYDSEVPSSADLEGDMDEGVNGYISTPGGRLWFIDAGAARAIMLCGLGCVAADPRFRPDPDLPVRQSYSLAELKARQN